MLPRVIEFYCDKNYSMTEMHISSYDPVSYAYEYIAICFGIICLTYSSNHL